MDPSVDTTPIAPALAAFFDDVLNDSVSQLNFRWGCCAVQSSVAITRLASSPPHLLAVV